MDVPEIPLSYSCTGAINSVTPIALMMPAISSIKKWKGESLARMFFFKVYLRGHRLAGGLPIVYRTAGAHVHR